MQGNGAVEQGRKCLGARSSALACLLQDWSTHLLSCRPCGWRRALCWLLRIAASWREPPHLKSWLLSRDILQPSYKSTVHLAKAGQPQLQHCPWDQLQPLSGLHCHLTLLSGSSYFLEISGFDPSDWLACKSLLVWSSTNYSLECCEEAHSETRFRNVTASLQVGFRRPVTDSKWSKAHQ